jgi:hypothetical protein
MSPSSHLNAPKPANPFAHRPSRGRAFEKGVLGVFRAATYLILLCGAVVFADIVIKGVPTVSSPDASGIAAAAAAAAGADFIALSLGSALSIEAEGKDRTTITMSDAQLWLIGNVTTAARAGTPIVALVHYGGAVDVTPLLANAAVQAVLALFTLQVLNALSLSALLFFIALGLSRRQSGPIARPTPCEATVRSVRRSRPRHIRDEHEPPDRPAPGCAKPDQRGSPS